MILPALGSLIIGFAALPAVAGDDPFADMVAGLAQEFGGEGREVPQAPSLPQDLTFVSAEAPIESATEFRDLIKELEERGFRLPEENQDASKRASDTKAAPWHRPG